MVNQRVIDQFHSGPIRRDYAERRRRIRGRMPPSPRPISDKRGRLGDDWLMAGTAPAIGRGNKVIDVGRAGIRQAIVVNIGPLSIAVAALTIDIAPDGGAVGVERNHVRGTRGAVELNAMDRGRQSDIGIARVTGAVRRRVAAGGPLCVAFQMLLAVKLSLTWIIVWLKSLFQATQGIQIMISAACFGDRPGHVKRGSISPVAGQSAPRSHTSRARIIASGD